MLFLVKEEASIVPAAGVFDLAPLIPEAYRHVGPIFACLDFWLVAPASTIPPAPPPDPGGFSAEVRWQDATGQLRVQTGPVSTISLNDPPPGEALPRQSTGFFLMKRAAPDSLLQLVTGVLNPGSARIGYCLLLGPAAPTDLIAL